MQNCLLRGRRTLKVRGKMVILMLMLMLVSFGIFVNLTHRSNITTPLSYLLRKQQQLKSENLPLLQVTMMEKETLKQEKVPLEDKLEPQEERVLSPPKRILLWTPFWEKKQRWFLVFSRLTSGQCEVNNCELVLDNKLLPSADAVVFHASDLAMTRFPARLRPHQPWIFFSLEAPPSVKRHRGMKSHYEGVFNWTMTYRLDSDLPVPYGRVHPRPEPSDPPIVKDYWASKSKTILAVWLASNCFTPSRREDLVKQLSRFLTVAIYGKCGKSKCGDRLTVVKMDTFNRTECDVRISKHMFYLALENSICKDYVTEKFYKALTLDVVPVVLGGADYTAIAPPNSYINALDFASPKQLADYLHQVAGNRSLYNKYFEWKNHYTVELGHPFSAMTCNLCAKLHDVNILNNSSSIIKSQTVVGLSSGRQDRDQPSASYQDMYKWFVTDSVCRMWNVSSGDLEPWSAVIRTYAGPSP